MHEPNRLSEIMYENNITYRELSRKSGISKSALNKIANFEEEPTQSTMISIAHALNLEVSDIFYLKWRRE